jgi:hypothetical protein
VLNLVQHVWRISITVIIAFALVGDARIHSYCQRIQLLEDPVALYSSVLFLDDFCIPIHRTPPHVTMDVPDGFSPAGVASLALTIQNRAFVAAEELARNEDTPELADALSPIATQIEYLGQLSTALHLALDARPAMTPRLQGCLNQYFNSCDTSLAGLTKQLMRLQPELLHDVNWHFLRSQQALLKSYNDLFAYLEEILRV